MQVDWLTVIAQIINFIILVWLLKRFLYGPIVNAMQAREQSIRQRMEDAETREAEAEQQAQLLQAQQRELEEQKEILLEEAKREVHAQRSEQLEALRSEIAATRTRWHEEVAYEKSAFLGLARSGIGQQACDIARHILRQLAGTDLEQQLVQNFLQRLEALEGDELQSMQQILKAAQAPVQLTTSFALTPSLLDEIRQALAALRGSEVEIEPQQDPEQICGISLQLGAHKLAWNIKDYLGDLENSLDSLLATHPVEEPTEDIR
jgi:F-type H+-transporting ATPase subunit b